MLPNPQSVIFGKAPIKTRASFHGSNFRLSEDASDKQVIENRNTGDLKGNVKLNSDDRMRLIQLEIAQKEACKVLKSICEDVSKQFDIASGSDAEISDFLTGILILGNLCKRIGKEKQEKESTNHILYDEIEKIKSSHQEVVAQLESSISNLQFDNSHLCDVINESALKYSHKVNLMSKEMFILQESLDKVKLENERLETKLQQAERRLMEVPRLEEAVLRNAKSMIRQQEITNTKSKIENKKNEDEFKNLTYWKNKAKVLEEENQRIQMENQAISAQARLHHNKYLSLLNQMERLKNNRTSLLRMEKGSRALRPSSAPSIHISSCRDQLDRKMQSVNPEEIVKLQKENKRKTQQVLSLAQKLSMARAYPLLTVDDGEIDGEHLNTLALDTSKAADPTRPRESNTANISDDLESLSSRFLQEENTLQAQRIADALQLQSELYDQHHKRLNSLPKHINAIRKSKHFGKHLDDADIQSY